MRETKGNDTRNIQTPPTTRIPDKTKITTPHTPTTLHHNTTNNTQPLKKHTTTHTTPHTLTQTLTPFRTGQISVIALRRIKDDALAEDLDRFNVDQGYVDVDIMIEQYDKYLSDLLNKHAPNKNIYVVDRPLNEWMTDDILTLKAIRRKNGLIWRKTRTTINFDIYYDSCKAVKEAISKRKSELMEQRVIDCEGDQKKLFSLIHSLLGSKKNTVLPEYTSSFTLASTINMFFYR